MTFTHALATNNYGVAKFIVDANPANGTHTTIQAAINSASSGDTIFIRPGTYTENLTLKDGINLTAFDLNDGAQSTVLVVGKMTATFTGECNFQGMAFHTNGDFALDVSGANATVLFFRYCAISAVANTAISYTCSNASSSIVLEKSGIDVETTGITAITKTSPGPLNLTECVISNPGASTTPITSSAGAFNINRSTINYPISISGSAAIRMSWCDMATNDVNQSCITYSSNLTVQFLYSKFTSGTASAFNASSGVIILKSCFIDSTNANTLTGAGTFQYDDISFLLSSGVNPTGESSLPQRVGLTRSVLQPAFSATHTIAQNNVTGSSTVVTVNFTTVIFDQAGNYDGTNTFTAPVTGKYQFNCAVNINDAATSTFGGTNITTSNRVYAGLNMAPYTKASLDQYLMPMSVLADMDAADTAIVKAVAVGMAGDTADLPIAATNTYFNGFLFC